MKNKITFLFILFCLFFLNSLCSQEFYVSPSGDDTNSGNENNPVSTIKRALELVKEREDASIQAVVWLMDGTYRLSESVLFDNTHSGTISNPLLIKSVNKWEAMITITKEIEINDLPVVTDTSLLNRMLPEARGKVVEVDMDTYSIVYDTWNDTFSASDIKIPGILYNNEILALSRYPNESDMTMKSVFRNSPGVFEYRDNRHNRWLEAVEDGLWLQGYWRVAWQYDAIKTDAIDVTNKVVWQKGSVAGGIGNKYTQVVGVNDQLNVLGTLVNYGESITIGDRELAFDAPVRLSNGAEPYIAINLIEEIDLPGEWAINFPRKKIYIYPPNGADKLTIADKKQPCFRFMDAANIVVEGIRFTGGKADAIEINGGSNIKIVNSEIDNFLEYGVVVNGGVNHTIQSCDIHHMGGGGIFLKGGSKATLTPANHKAINNYIYEYGQIKRVYAGAIEIPQQVDDNTGMYVAHNKIKGSPHVGIYFGGNNHVFEYNDISDICRVSNDMAGFYSWHDWSSYGNVIRYNYVHDAPQAHGYYADDGDSGDSVYGNIFYKIDDAIFIGGGHDNSITSNIAVSCNKLGHCDDRGVSRGYNLSNTRLVTQLTSVNYQSPPWSTSYPSIVNVLDEAYPQELPYGTSFNCNLGINCSTGLDFSNSASAWGVALSENENLSTSELTDPLNLSNLMNSSVILNKECLVDINVDLIGLIEDEYRCTGDEIGEGGYCTNPLSVDEVTQNDLSNTLTARVFNKNSIAYLSIDVPYSQLITIRIYDISGKLLKTLFQGNLNQGNQIIPLENLASRGVYLCKINKKTIKFINY